tara:strand:- start:8662 stop:10086 length:1425 start_codon:yes stop_codon:yes gene_type:complete
MNRIKRIAINTLSLSIAEIVVKVVQFFIFVFVARHLGNVIFGKFNFAYSFSIIAVIFADIGINYMLIREISRKKELLNKFVSNSFIIKTVFSVIIFILTILILNILKYPLETRVLIYLLLAYMFLRSHTELLFSIFKVFEKMHYEALIKSIGLISILVLGFVGLMFLDNIVTLALAFVIIQLFIFLITLVIVTKKFVKLKLEFDLNFSKKILKLAFPFSLAVIFAGIYFHIDNVMLSIMKGDISVAVYSAAYNITLALLFIPSMYSFAIYPILSRYYESDKKKVDFIYERSFKYLFMLGLPISVGLYIIAQNIILFIYGPNYATSIIVLKILAWFILFKFISFLTGILLSSINKQKFRMYGQGTAAFANLGLNFILIPKYSFIGAGIATIASELILFTITFIFVSKYFHIFNVFKILYKPILAVAVMTLAIIFLEINMFLLIFIGAAIYFITLYLLKAFDERDRSLMKNIVKTR